MAQEIVMTISPEAAIQMMLTIFGFVITVVSVIWKVSEIKTDFHTRITVLETEVVYIKDNMEKRANKNSP
jgi:hypothetical protein